LINLGSNAIKFTAAGDPYRIVVTDMQMPEMDGESPGMAIKADPLLCHPDRFP